MSISSLQILTACLNRRYSEKVTLNSANLKIYVMADIINSGEKSISNIISVGWFIKTYSDKIHFHIYHFSKLVLL